MSESKGAKPRFKEKIDTLNRFLADEHMLLHLGAQASGVQLPPYLMGNSTVTLKLSRYFRGTLDITKSEVRAELLFNDKYFTCVVPFEAVWGMTSFRGQFLMWPESTPQEVFDTIAQQAKEEESHSPTEDRIDFESDGMALETPAKEIRRGHLRRVK